MTKKRKTIWGNQWMGKTRICIRRFRLKFCMDILFFMADSLLHRQCAYGSWVDWYGYAGITFGRRCQ